MNSDKPIPIEQVAHMFTRSAPYSIDSSWSYLEGQLKSWDTPESPLVLEPDFQRAHVWNREQQINYVEYILRGGHAAKELYFNCSSWMSGFNTPLEIVDGKQRLEAARAFMRGDFPVFGEWRAVQLRLDMLQASFLLYINTLKTRAEVLQWYLDLNTGGTPHTADEIKKVRLLLNREMA